MKSLLPNQSIAASAVGGSSYVIVAATARSYKHHGNAVTFRKTIKHTISFGFTSGLIRVNPDCRKFFIYVSMGIFMSISLSMPKKLEKNVLFGLSVFLSILMMPIEPKTSASFSSVTVSGRFVT
jgi:hypothetical protein